MSGISGTPRRRVILSGAAGLAAGAGAGRALASDGGPAEAQPKAPSLGAAEVAFHGRRQPGIEQAAQAHGHLLAFDLDRKAAAAPDDARRAAAALLRRWSALAADLMAAKHTDGDPGIALDAGPSRLTLTFGFGSTFFDRTGLQAERPAALAPLPAFSRDALDAARSGGDLFVQIGADDALVAANALQRIRRTAGPSAAPRWSMAGFTRTPGATARPRTARNLMGQIDGTNNPAPGEKEFDPAVFVPKGGSPGWMADGSYAVVRRIRMLLDDWEGVPLPRQEAVIGRRKQDGAPLSGGSERTAPDLEATEDGRPVIAANAHIRITAPEANRGARMLRRTFSYHDGFRDDGAPDAGLLFVAWQADPRTAFVPLQRKLDRGDALSEFVRHEASAVFAVPGGAGDGEYVGQRLLEG